EAAASYFAVLYQGKNQRKRFESGMRREFDQTWLDLPVAVRNATFEGAVERTKGYGIKEAYRFNVLLGAPQNMTAITELLDMAKRGEGTDGNGRRWYEL